LILDLREISELSLRLKNRGVDKNKTPLQNEDKSRNNQYQDNQEVFCIYVETEGYDCKNTYSQIIQIC